LHGYCFERLTRYGLYTETALVDATLAQSHVGRVDELAVSAEPLGLTM
jgi:hypothetical protein